MSATTPGYRHSLVCALGVLIAVLQFLGGLRLGFLVAPEELLQRSRALDRTTDEFGEQSGRSQGQGIHLNVTWPTATVRSERQIPLARSTGMLIMVSSIVSLWGSVQIWRMKRTGLWLFFAAGLLTTAILWRFEGSADLSGVVGISIQLAITLVFSAVFALGKRKLH